MHPYLKYAPFYLLSFLPLWTIYLIAKLVYFIIYRLIGYRKKVVRSNLKTSFPNKNNAELQQIERDFYTHFCELFLESVKVLSISKQEAKKRLIIKNLEQLDNWYAEGKNVVLYSAHFGNWEWFAFIPLLVKHQFVSFYQEQTNSYFNDLSIHMRERFGNICVESKSGYKRLMEVQRSGALTLTFMIADQSPTANSSISWTTFLEQHTAFLVGPDRIARKTNAILLYPFIEMPEKGRYEIELREIPMEDSDKVVASFANLLEENILASPHLWLWTHKRWKHSGNQKVDELSSASKS